MNDTKRLKVTMYLDVDRESVDEITKITHHAERLLDLESYPEIKSVSGVTVENPDKDYTFKTIKEVADEIMTLPFGTSLDFTFDQPEDVDETFEPEGWYGAKIVRLFGEPCGTLCIGSWGGGQIYAKEIYEKEDVQDILQKYCNEECNNVTVLCVSKKLNGE